jgi:hypothetical protein
MGLCARSKGRRPIASANGNRSLSGVQQGVVFIRTTLYRAWQCGQVNSLRRCWSMLRYRVSKLIRFSTHPRNSHFGQGLRDFFGSFAIIELSLACLVHTSTLVMIALEGANMSAPLIVASKQVPCKAPSEVSLLQRILPPSIIVFGSIASIAWTAFLAYCVIKIVTAL